MSTPHRVQLRRTKGWRLPANTVKVDRSTRWGNPFHTHGDGQPMTPEVAVACFRVLLKTTGSWWARYRDIRDINIPPTTIEEVRAQLRGKNLACWCPNGSACHADVLLEIANNEGESNVD